VCAVVGRALVDGSVGPVAVVVLEVLGEDRFEVAAAEDEEPVEAFATGGAHESLGDRVGAAGARTPMKVCSNDDLLRHHQPGPSSVRRRRLANAPMIKRCPDVSDLTPIPGPPDSPSRDLPGARLHMIA
jgi:hypothetical protein